MVGGADISKYCAPWLQERGLVNSGLQSGGHVNNKQKIKDNAFGMQGLACYSEFWCQTTSVSVEEERGVDSLET